MELPGDELIQKLRSRPFAPFRIHVSGGSVYEIRHPDAAMPFARTVVIGVADDPVRHYYNRTVTVALTHITQLEMVGDTQPA
jgi:hypothetical protein